MKQPRLEAVSSVFYFWREQELMKRNPKPFHLLIASAIALAALVSTAVPTVKALNNLPQVVATIPPSKNLSEVTEVDRNIAQESEPATIFKLQEAEYIVWSIPDNIGGTVISINSAGQASVRVSSNEGDLDPTSARFQLLVNGIFQPVQTITATTVGSNATLDLTASGLGSVKAAVTRILFKVNRADGSAAPDSQLYNLSRNLRLSLPVINRNTGSGLSGSANVLKVDANPILAGATAYAFWNIPNFKEGCFDKGDGNGCKGPIAQAMRVDVPGVTGARALTLKWTNTSGSQQQDTILLNISDTASAECNANNPDWQAKAGNPENWTFCKRKDLEWVGNAPGQNVDRNDQTYSMAWDVYGVKGVYLVFEPNSTRGPAGSTQLSIPTTGTGPQSFKANQLEPGCYRITLRIDTNAGNRTDFGEKILCIGTGGSGSNSAISP
jgi:hypothetical protein